MKWILRLENGDVNKLSIVVTPDREVHLEVYDGTGGQKDDLLIQAKLNRIELLELARFIGVALNELKK